jgi:hypothetical protein
MRTAILAALVLGGCAARLTYPGLGTFDPRTETLGAVTVCRGGGCCDTDEGCQWPLALSAPPEAYTYQAALRDKAARVYHVPAEEIVLGDIAVEVVAELVGTVRAWKATATVGCVRR